MHAICVLLLITVVVISATTTTIQDCQVIIAGGTTAAYAAAIASAAKHVRTCLLEPTDWVGGQMTASGVPAIDFEWRNVKNGSQNFNMAQLDKYPANVTPSFLQALQQVGDMGKCWVSNYCYMPGKMLDTVMVPKIASLVPHLSVYYNTIVKRVRTKQDQIVQVTAIQRTTRNATLCNGYDVLPSVDVPDWYSAQDSERFTKQVLQFENDASFIVVDATEWGEVLALSQADYLQGIAEQFDGDTSGVGNDTCGQSIVYGFAERFAAQNETEPANPYPVSHYAYYSLEKFSWNQVWTYRRLQSIGTQQAQVNDVTLQNWGKGNDYAFGYLFKSRKDALRDVQQDEWMGGIDLQVLREAEYLAFGYHYWFKNVSTTPNRVLLDKSVWGTCHGLSKLPYIRDTRRSIGIDNFVLSLKDIGGDWLQNRLAKKFHDRVAIGSYPCDIHSISTCKYPDYMLNHNQSLPYYIPFRALTSGTYGNLLVAGKTMAQSFLTNAATRLHPVEYSSGTAAGVSAAFMAQNQIQSTQFVYQSMIPALQAQVAEFTPIEWTMVSKN